MFTTQAEQTKEAIKTWEPADKNIYPVSAWREGRGVLVEMESNDPNVLMSGAARSAAWDLRKDPDLGIPANAGVEALGGMRVIDVRDPNKRILKLTEDDKQHIRWRRLFRFTFAV